MPTMMRLTATRPIVLLAVLAIQLLAVASTTAQGEAATSQAVPEIVEFTEIVPMPDGIGLTTVVYLPKGESPFPTLLLVTPYGTDQEAPRAQRFARAGYAMVTQNVRGQGGSEGAVPASTRFRTSRPAWSGFSTSPGRTAAWV